jgi:hypothetical protein
MNIKVILVILVIILAFFIYFIYKQSLLEEGFTENINSYINKQKRNLRYNISERFTIINRVKNLLPEF